MTLFQIIDSSDSLVSASVKEELKNLVCPTFLNIELTEIGQKAAVHGLKSAREVCRQLPADDELQRVGFHAIVVLSKMSPVVAQFGKGSKEQTAAFFHNLSAVAAAVENALLEASISNPSLVEFSVYDYV